MSVRPSVPDVRVIGGILSDSSGTEPNVTRGCSCNCYTGLFLMGLFRRQICTKFVQKDSIGKDLFLTKMYALQILRIESAKGVAIIAWDH